MAEEGGEQSVLELMWKGKKEQKASGAPSLGVDAYRLCVCLSSHCRNFCPVELNLVFPFVELAISGGTL